MLSELLSPQLACCTLPCAGRSLEEGSNELLSLLLQQKEDAGGEEGLADVASPKDLLESEESDGEVSL